MSHLQKSQSMASVYSNYSLGALSYGMGYLARKPKPDKPYGLSFLTRMNRTHRGPGLKYLYYALACAITALFFFMGGALYFGHRNVSRMIVMRTEVLGAIMVVGGIICVSLVGRFIYRARVESNMWRAGVTFKPEGLFTARAVNDTYIAQDETKLATGTYGAKALKKIPKPRPKGAGKKKKKGRSRAGSKSSLVPDTAIPTQGAPASRMYDKRGQTHPSADPIPTAYGYPDEAEPRGPLYSTDDYLPAPQQGYSAPNPAYAGEPYFPETRGPLVHHGGYHPPPQGYGAPPGYAPRGAMQVSGSHTAESEL